MTKISFHSTLNQEFGGWIVEIRSGHPACATVPSTSVVPRICNNPAPS
jgi:hypothetical protein